MNVNAEITALMLLQREHDRLKKPLRQLSTFELDVDKLETLAQRWEKQLCFEDYAMPLLDSMNALIARRRTEAYPVDAYQEVIYQVHAYRHSSWMLLHQEFGNRLAPYLNEWGHLRKQYQNLYRRITEPDTKLSVTTQAEYLRSQVEPHLPSPVAHSPQQSQAGESQARLETNEAVLKALSNHLGLMAQLMEEAEYPRPSTADVVDLQYYRQANEG